MKSSMLLISPILLLFSCGGKSNQESIYVNNIHELNKAIGQVIHGDEIVLANGVWSDVKINFFKTYY